MKLLSLVVFGVGLVHAHNNGLLGAQAHNLAARQASSATAPPTVFPSFSLLSTNPTAVPLSSIVSNAPILSTIPLSSTPTVGSVPSYIPGAPGLPDAAALIPSNYPALDKYPPTNSSEVLQWIQEVQVTGVQIPNITPNVAGGCPANLQAAANQSNCWWTCGGCTRATDVTYCPNKLTWGLTYDDGPSPYTPNLLSYLDQQNLKTTFFVVGSRAISYPHTLQYEYLDQHQIAVHTWSHPPLTTLTNDQIIAELGWTKKIIKDVLGVTPNYMRPPYGDIDDRVRAISLAMGLTPVMWTRISPMATFDTGDFTVNAGLTTVQQVLANWDNILSNATQINTGFIVLEHDLFQQTVEIATGYILPDGQAFTPKLTIEPVIKCLNKPMQDAYIETNNNASNPQPANSIYPSVANPSSGAGSGQATASPGAGTSSGIRIGVPVASIIFIGIVAGLFSI